MLDPYFASVIVFFMLIALWMYKDRKKIEVKSYVLFMRRTKRFKNFIDRVARKSPKFWKIIATIAVFVAFYYMIQVTYLLSMNSYNIFLGKGEEGLKLILPSTSSSGSSSQYHIGVPFWYWIIIIICILVPHELSHGIIARAEKIRLKSVGVLLMLFFLPGAFVETDDKQLKKAKLMTRLRVFAAGSAANLLVAALILALTMYIIWPATVGSGVELLYVNATSPAAMAGLTANMTLSHVNDQQITTTYKEYLAGKGYFFEEIGATTPGQAISFTSDGDTYNLTLGEIERYNAASGETEKLSYMGIIAKPVYHAEWSSLFFLLTMLWYFSLAVGMFNLLPLYPLDGGLMIETITDRFAKKRSKDLVKIISIVILLIIIYNAIGPSIMSKLL